MDKPTGAVLPFPVHRRSTLDETLEGFPGRAGGATIPGNRTTRRVTVLYTDIRGWTDAAERDGAADARALLARAVDRAVDAIRGQFRFEQFAIAADDAQQIIEIVRDPAGKLAQSLHPLRLPKLLFE